MTYPLFFPSSHLLVTVKMEKLFNAKMRYRLKLLRNSLSYNDFHSVCKNEFQKAIFFTTTFSTSSLHIDLSYLTRMLRSMERLRKSAGAGGFDFFSNINYFIAPDRKRSGAFSIPIHPDIGACFCAGSKIFANIFTENLTFRA